MSEWFYKMFNNPYFQNVASDFITLVILVLIGWLIYSFSHRSPLLKFFGIKKTKKIVLYLSHLRIRAGQNCGAVGVDDVVRSFQESALPLYETRLIAIFQRLFNFVIPGISSQPGFLKWLLISDVEVEVLPSPLNIDDVERQTTFIAIGSPGYNIASTKVENIFRSLGRFTRGNLAIELNGSPPLTDTTCSFVQRVVDQTTGQYAFYVAGMSSLGTTGAAYFLASRWQYLTNKYPGDKPFCIMLRISGTDARKHDILYERG